MNGSLSINIDGVSGAPLAREQLDVSAFSAGRRAPHGWGSLNSQVVRVLGRCCGGRRYLANRCGFLILNPGEIHYKNKWKNKCSIMAHLNTSGGSKSQNKLNCGALAFLRIENGGNNFLVMFNLQWFFGIVH